MDMQRYKQVLVTLTEAELKREEEILREQLRAIEKRKEAQTKLKVEIILGKILQQMEELENLGITVEFSDNGERGFGTTIKGQLRVSEEDEEKYLFLEM